MKIDGKKIAQTILQDLSKRVKKLKEKKIIPQLAIILIGDNPASSAYVRQKVLRAKEIGARTLVKKLSSNVSQTKLLSTIQQLNNNNNIHGIIVQRPLPPHIDIEQISDATDPHKDVDGLHPNSPFPMPLAAAVLKILDNIFKATPRRSPAYHLRGRFISWLKTKKIVTVGKGETGGGAIIKHLKTTGLTPQVIDSKTLNPDEVLKTADIIISAVGKPNIVKLNNIKNGVILIGIGLHQGTDNKLHGDYEEEEIADIASFYTPTPGGVGPVNVAMLLANLVNSAENLSR